MATKIISLDNLASFWTNVKQYLKDNTDKALSSTSENPVQNKVIKQAMDDMHWEGTQAQLDAALQAGTIKDGTHVFVTDDYSEPTVTDIATAAIEELFA